MASLFSFQPVATAPKEPSLPRINSTFTSRIRNPGPCLLLDYLARRFDYRTREQWSDLIDLGRLELEGRPARADDPLRENQVLRFAVVDYEEPEVPVDFSLLNPGPDGRPAGDLAFLHKPAGLPIHRTGKIFFQTLANLARERFGDMTWAPLNRLDRETSGIVAFARGPEAFRALAPSSPDAAWTKLYVAVVKGVLPGDDIGEFNQPLGEIPGDAIRCRMHAHAQGKPAVTLYQSIATKDGKSLVVLSPITGRKHQLRVHLAESGCPVVGDKIYSGEGRAYLTRLDRELGDEDYAVLGARRHLLHAFYLEIEAKGAGRQEVWDWDAGAEFNAGFGLELARDWKDSPSGLAFIERARDARRNAQWI